MKKYLMLMAVLAGLLLSACDTAPPSDWCYIFDFRGSQNGFSLPAGVWVEGVGLKTDSTGLLQASYQYDRFVLARSIIAKVVRGSDTGDIATAVRGSVFALPIDFDGTIPGGIDTVDITKNNSGITEGNDINFTLDTAVSGTPKELYIESLRINGDGSLPFNQNSCAGPTLTPDIQISGTSPAITPSTTATATGTAIPGTETGTPTPTPTSTACPSGGPPVTDEWSYGTVDSVVGSVWTVSSELISGFQRIRWGYQSSWGYAQLDSQDLISGTSISAYLENTDGTSVYFADLPENLRYIYYDALAENPFTIEFTFNEGICPPTPTPAPSNTPGATATPGATSTAEPLWTACLDFTTSDFAFTGIDATYEEGLGWVQDAGEWGIWRTGIGPSGKKKFKFEFTGAWAGSIRLTNTGGTPATGWKLGSGSSFIINFADESWTPTQNLFIEFDGNYGPYTLQKLCWVDQNPSTATPGPGTGTPLYTRTPLASLTAPVNPSRTPVLVPVPIIYITATSGAVITTTPIYGGTGVYSATGTPYGTPVGTPGTGGTGYGSGGGGFGDVGDMIGFGWNIGWGLFGALIAYVGQATSIITGLLTAFGSAQPQPIPGLPMCMSNPTAHDICAIYYIMDWTVFAPATPGAFIIPLVMIVMNIYIAIYFVRWVIRIVRRGESVTDAN